MPVRNSSTGGQNAAGRNISTVEKNEVRSTRTVENISEGSIRTVGIMSVRNSSTGGQNAVGSVSPVGKNEVGSIRTVGTISEGSKRTV